MNSNENDIQEIMDLLDQQAAELRSLAKTEARSEAKKIVHDQINKMEAGKFVDKVIRGYKAAKRRRVRAGVMYEDDASVPIDEIQSFIEDDDDDDSDNNESSPPGMVHEEEEDFGDYDTSISQTQKAKPDPYENSVRPDTTPIDKNYSTYGQGDLAAQIRKNYAWFASLQRMNQDATPDFDKEQKAVKRASKKNNEYAWFENLFRASKGKGQRN